MLLISNFCNYVLDVGAISVWTLPTQENVDVYVDVEHTHFGVISKSFQQGIACVAIANYPFPVIIQKYSFTHFCDLVEIKHTEHFILLWFNLQYTIVSDTIISFHVKFNSLKIHVFLFFYFVVFCFISDMGNRFTWRPYLIYLINLRPVFGVNFTSIWEDY